MCYIINQMIPLPPSACLLHPRPITAHSLWTALDQYNTSLGQTLTRLCELYEKDQHLYVETVRWISGLMPVQVRDHSNKSLPCFHSDHDGFLSYFGATVLTHVPATVARKPSYAARAVIVPRGVLRSASTHRGTPSRASYIHRIIH